MSHEEPRGRVLEPEGAANANALGLEHTSLFDK